MAKNKIPPSDEKLIDVFAELLDLDLLPDTLEDAEAVILDSGIDIKAFEHRSLEVLREILVDFPEDWRNVTADEMSASAARIEEYRLKSHLSKQMLKERITTLLNNIASRGKSKWLQPGLAHRNLEKQSKDDLVRLLRQLEFAADELGIELEED